jgi:hypothetical protein
MFSQQEVLHMTRSKSFKSVFALGAVILAMLSFAPASFAGEDDDEDGAARPQQTASGGGGGGSDSGSASGGVQTGFGGMSAEDGSLLLPLGLAGGGVIVLSAAGALSRRRVLEQ